MGKGGRVSEPHAANPRRSSGREGRFPSYPITGRCRHLPGLRGIELPRLRFSSISKRARRSRGRGGSAPAAPARCQSRKALGPAKLQPFSIWDTFYSISYFIIFIQKGSLRGSTPPLLASLFH